MDEKISREDFEYGLELFAKIVGGTQDWRPHIPERNPSLGHSLAQHAWHFTNHLASLKKTYCRD